MGLFDFVKRAGKALGIGSDAEAAPAADDLKKELEDLGLDASGMNIEVDGDKVKVTGSSVSQEMKEKVILAVGNVEGVAQVEEEIETEDAAADPIFHTVEKGDTLWAISSKHLGKGARYMEIFELFYVVGMASITTKACA